MKVKRLGVSMRIVQSLHYVEPRDALAQDWSAWLGHDFPEVAWLALPNLGANIAAYAEQWQLDGILLTGGEDLGVQDRRDATEQALLHWALQKQLPVLGVCRGAQLLWRHLGGEMTSVSQHVACEHPVYWQEVARRAFCLEGEDQVASYHQLGLSPLAEADVQILALTQSGQVEAFWHPRHRLMGVMWHPERWRHGAHRDIGLIRRFWGYE